MSLLLWLLIVPLLWPPNDGGNTYSLWQLYSSVFCEVYNISFLLRYIFMFQKAGQCVFMESVFTVGQMKLFVRTIMVL